VPEDEKVRPQWPSAGAGAGAVMLGSLSLLCTEGAVGNRSRALKGKIKPFLSRHTQVVRITVFLDFVH
jgi:hypothetical protein